MLELFLNQVKRVLLAEGSLPGIFLEVASAKVAVDGLVLTDGSEGSHREGLFESGKRVAAELWPHPPEEIKVACECWTCTESADPELSQLRPKDRPDRVESLLVISYALNWDGAEEVRIAASAKYFQLVRAGGVLDLVPINTGTVEVVNDKLGNAGLRGICDYAKERLGAVCK